MNVPAMAADGLEVYRPGSGRYAQATSPHNPIGAQHPVAVVVPAGGAHFPSAGSRPGLSTGVAPATAEVTPTDSGNASGCTLANWSIN